MTLTAWRVAFVLSILANAGAGAMNVGGTGGFNIAAVVVLAYAWWRLELRARAHRERERN